MNKELTPLETWYLVKEYLNIFHHRIVSENTEVETIEGHPINIIENALKETEKIKKCYKNELKNVSYYNYLALKYKKALEIIKEHRLDIDWFLQFVAQDISYQHYVYCVEQSNNAFAKRFLLNEQEYELLKEILK